jgi:hypothetical protein
MQSAPACFEFKHIPHVYEMFVKLREEDEHVKEDLVRVPHKNPSSGLGEANKQDRTRPHIIRELHE